MEPVTEYEIDPAISRFTVRGFASGMLSGFGHDPVLGIRDFAGSAVLNGDVSLRMRIRAGSLEVQNNVSLKDRAEMKRLMDSDVLEISRFPEIVFESSTVRVDGDLQGNFRATIEGSLTLHGATRRLEVPVVAMVLGDTLRANGEFAMRLTQFGMRPPSVAGGTLKLKDEIKLAFDIMARRKADHARAVG